MARATYTLMVTDNDGTVWINESGYTKAQTERAIAREEANGFNVSAAPDGSEALAELQDFIVNGDATGSAGSSSRVVWAEEAA